MDKDEYAVGIDKAMMLFRLGLPFASLMSGFRAGLASDNTQLSFYRQASIPTIKLKSKRARLADPFSFLTAVGIEPTTTSV